MKRNLILGALFCLPLMAYSQSVAIGSSLMIDGGFENGLTAWTQNWSSTVSVNSATPLAGTQSLRLTISPGGRGQPIANIEPGARYRLTGMGRLSAAGEMATIGIVFTNAAGVNILDQWVQVPNTTAQTYGFDLQAPAGAAEVYVYAFKNSGNQPADFDNLNLVKIADQ